MTSPAVVVIGAGPAGLAIAARLSRTTIDYVVLERACVGNTWWNQYDTLTLNSVKQLSHLPGMRMPRRYPLYPTAREFATYLQAYAALFRIPVRSGCEVTSLRRENDTWIVSTSAGEIQPKIVVIATGTWGNPFVPSIAGLSEFAGPVIHSSAYRSARNFRRGRALVIGNGSSAADVAIDLARGGHMVLLSFRNGFNILPRPSGFVVPYIANYLTRWRPAYRLLTAAAGRFRRDYQHLGLPTHPDANTHIDQRLILGDDLVQAVRSGAIRPVPEVQRFLRDAVVLDQKPKQVDFVVLATGYRPAVSFAQPYVRCDRHGYVVETDHGDNPPLFSIGLAAPAVSPEGVLPGLSASSARLMSKIAACLDGHGLLSHDGDS